jgi:hypothetical protein
MRKLICLWKDSGSVGGSCPTLYKTDGGYVVQGDYTQLARESTLIRHLEVAVVPGLLQTPAYARAMFAEMTELVGREASDLDAAVAARLQRQSLLYQPERQFEFLLTEAVLRWLLVPADVMRGQLDRLHSVIGLPNVRFGILPLGIRLHAIPRHSVVIYQGAERVAAVELFAAESFYRGEDADAFNRAIDRLWADALVGEDARQLILDAAAKCR